MTAPAQFYAFAPPQVRVIGDRWDVPAAFQDGSGNPLDLSVNQPVGLLYVTGSATPIPLTVGNGGVVVTGPGTAIFTALGSVTSAIAPQDPIATLFPVRLAIGLIDATDQRSTYLIQPFIPVDGRSASS